MRNITVVYCNKYKDHTVIKMIRMELFLCGLDLAALI